MPTILTEYLAWEWLFGDLSEERITEIARYQFPADLMPACTISKDFRSDLEPAARNGNPLPDKRVEKTPEEWKAILTKEQFTVTRLKGTERAFSSQLCSYFESGRYACVCCGTELFEAGEKFESGTGWPSFTQPIKENVVAYHKDRSFGMVQIEALCNTCDAHLGHVFQDGPLPSGLRYCMNAVSLKKVEVNEKKIDFEAVSGVLKQSFSD